MSLHGCLRCLKYLVFVLNFIVWVTGIAMLALAIYLRLDPSTNHLVTTSHTQEVRMYHLICYILIGVGAVMTFIGFLGCCSAFQESRCMLGTFFAFLLILCAAEVTSGVWAFLHRDKVKTSVTETMTVYIRHTYSDDPLINEPIDYVQKNLNCCGAIGPDDWNNSRWQNSSSGHYGHLPGSCCLARHGQRTSVPNMSAMCSYSKRKASTKRVAHWTEGCSEKVIAQFNKRLFIFGLAALSLTGVQMLSLFFSIALCCGLCRQSAGGYKS